MTTDRITYEQRYSIKQQSLRIKGLGVAFKSGRFIPPLNKFGCSELKENFIYDIILSLTLKLLGDVLASSCFRDKYCSSHIFLFILVCHNCK